MIVRGKPTIDPLASVRIAAPEPPQVPFNARVAEVPPPTKAICPACIALNGTRPCSVKCWQAAGYQQDASPEFAEAEFHRVFADVLESESTKVVVPRSEPIKAKVYEVQRDITISWGGQMIRLREGDIVSPESYTHAGIQRMRDAGVALEETDG